MEHASTPVVVALAVTSQPMTRDELVVVQLEESELVDVQDTQYSVTVDDSEHDVGDSEGSGEGPGSGLGEPSGSGSSGSKNPNPGPEMQSTRQGR